MIDSSPIDTWEGATVFYSFAGGAGTDLFFWLMVILCIVPLFITFRTEQHHEHNAK